MWNTGSTMVIVHGSQWLAANPSQELLMNAAFASDLLLAREESDIRCIERMNMLAVKVRRSGARACPGKKSGGG